MVAKQEVTIFGAEVFLGVWQLLTATADPSTPLRFAQDDSAWEQRNVWRADVVMLPGRALKRSLIQPDGIKKLDKNYWSYCAAKPDLVRGSTLNTPRQVQQVCDFQSRHHASSD